MNSKVFVFLDSVTPCFPTPVSGRPPPASLSFRGVPSEERVVGRPLFIPLLLLLLLVPAAVQAQQQSEEAEKGMTLLVEGTVVPVRSEKPVEPDTPVQVSINGTRCRGDLSHTVVTEPLRSLNIPESAGRFISPFYCRGHDKMTYITQGMQNAGNGKGVVVTRQWVGQGRFGLTVGENVNFRALIEMLGVSAAQDKGIEGLEELLEYLVDEAIENIAPTIATSMVSHELYVAGTEVRVPVRELPPIRRRLNELRKEKQKLLATLKCKGSTMYQDKYEPILRDAQQMVRDLRAPRGRWNPRKTEDAARKLLKDVEQMHGRLNSIEPRPSLTLDPGKISIQPGAAKTTQVDLSHDCGNDALAPPRKPNLAGQPAWATQNAPMMPKLGPQPYQVNAKPGQPKDGRLHELQFSVKDRAGQLARATLNLRVQEVSPSLNNVSIGGAQPGGEANADVSVSDKNARDPGDETIDVDITGDPIAAGANPDQPISDGKASYTVSATVADPYQDDDYEAQVEITDQSDKQDRTTATLAVENVVPSVLNLTTAVDALSPGETTTVKVTGTVEDRNTLDDITTLTWTGTPPDGGAINPKQRSESDPWSTPLDGAANGSRSQTFMISVPKKSDGAATIRLEAVDEAGSGQSSLSIPVEELEPEIDGTWNHPDPVCPKDPIEVQTHVQDGNGDDDVETAWGDPSWSGKTELTGTGEAGHFEGRITAPETPGTYSIAFEATDGNTRVRSGGEDAGPNPQEVVPCNQRFVKLWGGIADIGQATVPVVRGAYLPVQTGGGLLQVGATVGVTGTRTFEPIHTQATRDRIQKGTTQTTLSKPSVVVGGIMAELDLVEVLDPSLQTPWFADLNVQTLGAQTGGTFGAMMGGGLEVGRRVARPASALDVYLTGEWNQVVAGLGFLDALKTVGVGVRYRY